MLARQHANLPAGQRGFIKRQCITAALRRHTYNSRMMPGLRNIRRASPVLLIAQPCTVHFSEVDMLRAIITVYMCVHKRRHALQKHK